MAVDHGVPERGADRWDVTMGLRRPVQVAGGREVPLSPWSAEVAPAAAVGDVAVLHDVDMDQVPGRWCFVAADRLACDAIDVGDTVDPVPDQHRVHRRGRNLESATDLDRPSRSLSQVHDPAHHRRRCPARLGWWCGREDRSIMPAGPSTQ